MAIMSIRVDEKRKKQLKVLASIEGKTIGSILEEMIEERVQKRRIMAKNDNSEESTYNFAILSEPSFSEWNNSEDEIYNDL